MATVILVRHGRSTANTSGVLAGRTRGVHLDDVGREQSRVAGERCAGLPVAAIVTSPLERCRETARALAAALADPPPPVVERGLLECEYGEWQGRPIAELAKEKLWKVVQQQPSAVTFPGGESMPAMQARATAAVRRWDDRITEEHGADAVWMAVSHGDIIKSILADALGTHLDQFQRIQVDPASVSIVRYTPVRPFVLGMNTHAGSLDWLRPARRRRRRKLVAPGDAVIGGGAGPSTASE